MNKNEYERTMNEVRKEELKDTAGIYFTTVVWVANVLFWFVVARFVVTWLDFLSAVTVLDFVIALLSAIIAYRLGKGIAYDHAVRYGNVYEMLKRYFALTVTVFALFALIVSLMIISGGLPWVLTAVIGVVVSLYCLGSTTVYLCLNEDNLL